VKNRENSGEDTDLLGKLEKKRRVLRHFLKLWMLSVKQKFWDSLFHKLGPATLKGLPPTVESLTLWYYEEVFSARPQGPSWNIWLYQISKVFGCRAM